VRQQLAALGKKVKEDDYLDLLGDPDWLQDKLRGLTNKISWIAPLTARLGRRSRALW
jgi:hypothetical protein